jgi:tripartite-type tricarboxylate transporter receptor subunit TctC
MKILFFILAAALAAAMPAAHGQSYPSKGLRLIVPFPAGGSSDMVGRLLAQRMSESMGQPVVVDNRPGAASIIANDTLAKAAPDGHTLLLGTDGAFTLNPILYSKLPYDSERDFAPISLVASQSLFVVASASAPGKNLLELIAYARANPGKVTFGTSALMSQIVGEQIKVTAGIDMLHVPFKGAPPMLQALFAGDIDLVIAGIQPYATYTKEGKLRGFATTGNKREQPTADTPTVGELGFSEMEYRQWFGLFAPAATPNAILVRLHTEVAKALSDPATRERLVSSGMEATTSTPEELTAKIKSEIVKWRKVIQVAGITMLN